jgi:energy-coupling factor transporter ATP-binding protein EcfA2
VDWELNPDVNILVGENGSGKSTILLAMYLLLNRNYGLMISKELRLEKIITILNDNTIIEQKPKKINNEGRGFTTKSDLFQKSVTIEYINTFDNLFSETRFDKFNGLNNSFLDLKLEECITKYIEYQLRQYKKATRDGLSIKEVSEKQNFFIATINRLFAVTNKRLDENEERIFFILDTQKAPNYVSPHQLSSGEKQLLIILLTVLCQEEEPFVLLLDEPEISLHFEWQYELIQMIRTLNPNCQLIIATHSVGIFAKGWNDKIFDMLPGKHGRNPILKPIND